MSNIRTAYIHGLNFVTGDFVIIMDADFSHHVSLLLMANFQVLTSAAKIYSTIYPVTVIQTSISTLLTNIYIKPSKISQLGHCDWN